MEEGSWEPDSQYFQVLWGFLGGWWVPVGISGGSEIIFLLNCTVPLSRLHTASCMSRAREPPRRAGRGRERRGEGNSWWWKGQDRSGPEKSRTEAPAVWRFVGRANAFIYAFSTPLPLPPHFPQTQLPLEVYKSELHFRVVVFQHSVGPPRASVGSTKLTG